MCLQIISMRAFFSKFFTAFLVMYMGSANALIIIPIPAPTFPVCPELSKEQIRTVESKVKKTIGKFFNSYQNSNFFTRGTYDVLVSPLDSKGEVFVWAKITDSIEDAFSSKIVQVMDPKGISKLKVGDKITGKRDAVIDWYYQSPDGKVYGDYYVRTRMTNCSAADQKLWLKYGYQPDEIPPSW